MKPKIYMILGQAVEAVEKSWTAGHINSPSAEVIRRALEALDD